MRISNPEEKGRTLAYFVQGLLILGSIALYVWGNSHILVVDSSGSPGKYRTGLTENK